MQKTKNKTKIKTENLNLFYGAKQALKEINIEIPEYQVMAFIGPSGCGKSTLIKTLNRMNDFSSSSRYFFTVLLSIPNLFDNSFTDTSLPT